MDTREVFFAGVTTNPTGAWTTQAAQNLFLTHADRLENARALVRDRGSDADGAWFGFLGDFMRDVFMPNGVVFMALVVLFEVAVAVLIAGRGTAVDAGVVASVMWVLAVLPFLAWPYRITNIVLAVVQALVALRTYNTPVWPTRRGASPDLGVGLDEGARAR